MNKPLVIQPIRQALIRQERCENCKYAERESSALFACHYNPPTVALAPTNQGPIPVSFYPPVQAEHWCGRFVQRITMDA